MCCGLLPVRLETENISQTIELLQQKWHKFQPNRPLSFEFLDDAFNSQYRMEEKLRQIFVYFTLFAIFIACLGLLGLASFSAEQRTKEIGIRKVLGASISGILLLLAKEFTRWVLVANIIAWPIAWFALQRWLMNFAYRIEISWWIFVLAGGLAFLVSLLTVIFQAFRAARANPVVSLRYE